MSRAKSAIVMSFTRTNIEVRFRRVSFADENASLGQIIRKDEFEPRGGNNLGSPTVNVWGTGFVATSLAMDFFNAISLRGRGHTLT